jgi:hypothetical protein
MLKPCNYSNSTQVAILVKDLNQTAIELGAEPGVPTLFDVKGDQVAGFPMISESSITISVNIQV